MNITHLRRVDLARQMPLVPVDAVQGDGNTRILRLTLLENGTEWAVPEGITAAVAFRKSDSTKGLYDTLPDGTKAVTVDGSTVSAVLAPQVLTCPGEVTVSVVFHDEKLNQLAAFPVPVRVAANPAAGQTPSNDYYYYSTMADISKAMEEAMAALEQETQAFLAKSEAALQTVHDTATEDAPAIVCEAVGEVINVANAANRPLKGLTLYGKTTQSGTPTPDAPVALEGVGESIGVTVAGKNLLNITTGGTYTGATETVSNGLVSFNGTANSNGGRTAWKRSDVLILPPGTYYLSMIVPSGTAPKPCITEDGTSTLILGMTGKFTLESEKAVYAGFNYIAGEIYDAKNVAVQLEVGSAPTEYEPYKSAQTLTASTEGGLPGIPVSSGGNYTDEAGQHWICDEIDFARGVRIRRVEALAHDGSEPWEIVSQLDNGIRVTAYGVFRNKLKNPNLDLLCSHFAVQGYAPGVYQGSNSSPSYFVPFSTLDEWKAFLAQQYTAGTPLVTIAPLAEPTETPLSAEELAAYAALHSSKPNTTAFNDAGAGMKLAYVADTKTYIDQKIAAISAALLG